ncbi:hypothetical protein Ciccas_004870, partial [Cichlidogyrus casuarinus]
MTTDEWKLLVEMHVNRGDSKDLCDSVACSNCLALCHTDAFDLLHTFASLLKEMCLKPPYPSSEVHDAQPHSMDLLALSATRN